MSTKTQKEVETKAAESKATIIGEGILTKGGTLIIGSELVGPKMTALMCEAMNSLYDDSHPVALILRNDGFPNEAFGMTFADAFSIVINVDRCWDHACGVAMEDKKDLSFLGILWTSILAAVGHELDHLDIAVKDRELYEVMRGDEEGQKDLEKAASDAEERLICLLAKTVDVEIPAASELGWLGLKWMELHTDKATSDLEWVVKARKQLESGNIYNGEVQATTFRAFVQMAYEQSGDAWEQATNPISLTTYMHGSNQQLLLPAEPVAQPVVDAVEEAAQHETVQMVAQPGGMFVNAGMTVEDDSPDVVMVDATGADGQPTIDFAAAAQTVAPAVPIENDGAAQAEAAAIEATMSVPMAGPAAVQAEHVAAAANTAIPPLKTPATTYAPCALDHSVMPAVMEQIWKVIYHHVFTKCGWMQNPQTGRFYFSTAASVLEGINIQHIITQFGADGFIMEYDTLNAQGQPAAEQCQGMLRGYLTSKQGLPAYAIYLNINGKRYKRTFLPQNPEKKTTSNAYTNSAESAGQGHQIAWVFKDEVPDSAQFTEKCAVKITNSPTGIIYEVIS